MTKEELQGLVAERILNAFYERLDTYGDTFNPQACYEAARSVVNGLEVWSHIHLEEKTQRLIEEARLRQERAQEAWRNVMMGHIHNIPIPTLVPGHPG